MRPALRPRRTTLALVVTAGITGALLVAVPAGAAPLAVNTTGDTVDATPGDGTCADAANACSLRAAVMEAAMKESTAVTLPAGTFALARAGAGEDAGVTGDLDVPRTVKLTGAGIDKTVLDGAGLDRMLDVSPGGALVLEDLTVKGGLADADGGALRVTRGVLTLRRVSVTDSVADGDGGAIFASESRLRLTDVALARNAAAYGGAVYAEAVDLDATGGTWKGNVADRGGALAGSALRSLALTGTTIEGNDALIDGGGVWLRGSDGAGPTFALTDVTLTGNSANDRGGAIATERLQGVSDQPTLTLTGCTVQGNAASAGGGLSTLGPLALVRTTLSGNRAERSDGGGLQADGPVTMREVAFRDNSAAEVGGGAVFSSTATGSGLTYAGNAAGDHSSAYLDTLGNPLGTPAISGGTVDGDPDPSPVLVISEPRGGTGQVLALATPQRVLDTRSGLGAPTGRKSGDVVLALTGVAPPGATSAVLNVTVTGATTAGHVVARPAGAAVPGSSNVNVRPGQTQANEVVVPVSDDGRVTLRVERTSAHLIADLAGWVMDGAAEGAGALTALPAPVRLLDTRTTRTARVTGPVSVNLAGAVPEGATAALLNVTLTAVSSAGHATVHPGGSARPGTSNVNVRPGQTQANEVLTRLGPGGAVVVDVQRTTASVVVDLVGYVAPGAGQLQVLPSAQRVVDTRSGLGLAAGRVAGPASLTLPTPPEGATAVLLNVTAVGATRPAFVTAYPGGSKDPGTSNVNVATGVAQANEVLTALGPGGTVTLSVGGGARPASHLVVDVVGYVVG